MKWIKCWIYSWIKINTAEHHATHSHYSMFSAFTMWQFYVWIFFLHKPAIIYREDYGLYPYGTVCFVTSGCTELAGTKKYKLSGNIEKWKQKPFIIWCVGSFVNKIADLTCKCCAATIYVNVGRREKSGANILPYCRPSCSVFCSSFPLR